MNQNTGLVKGMIAVACLLMMMGLAACALVIVPASAQEPGAGERVDFAVDTPFFTTRGTESPMMALIQTEEEIEFIGDYLGLDLSRAETALRLLTYVDFEDKMLLVVNAGPMTNGMLRVDAVYELDTELHVEIVLADIPDRYRDSESGTSALSPNYPSLVTVLPRYQGSVTVHTVPGPWTTSGDLRGIGLLIVPVTGEDQSKSSAD